MKLAVVILLAATTVYGQKTNRQTISEFRDVKLTRNVTENDTVFFMAGQNAAYLRIVDIVMLKSGSASDINNLLTECMKFLPEDKGTSIEFQGNTLRSMGGKKIMLSGSGRDDGKYIIVNAGLITKFQADLQPHL